MDPNLNSESLPRSIECKPSVLQGDHSLLRIEEIVGKRKRSLTIPLPEQKRSIFSFRRSRQKTYDQSQSPLFRLPLELRTLIWKHAVGGLFVIMGSGVDCKISTEDCSDGMTKPHNKRLLNLLLTCRQIYSETINILYSTSLFEFPDAYHIWYDWKILPQRLHAIKALVIHPIYAGHAGFQPGWRYYWYMVSELHGLRYLYANVVYSFDVTEEGIELMLQPLMNVRHLEDFRLTLIWTPGDTQDHPVKVPANAPFTLAKVVDAVVESRRPRHGGWNMDPIIAVDMLEEWITRTLRVLRS